MSKKSNVCPECNEVLTDQGYCFACKAWKRDLPGDTQTGKNDSKWEKVRIKDKEQFGKPATAQSSSATETTLADLVSAQNRTTAAIRSLSIFFFVNLGASVLAGLILGIGFVTVKGESTYSSYTDSYVTQPPDYSGFITFASLVYLFGFLIALSKGIQELGKSS